LMPEVGSFNVKYTFNTRTRVLSKDYRFSESVNPETGKKDAIWLKDIIGDTLFTTLAGCAWYAPTGETSVTIKAPSFDTDDLDNSIVENVTVNDTTYYVDRETVLLTVLETLVFQPGIRDLLAKFVTMFDFSDEALLGYKTPASIDEFDVNGLLSVLVYGVFNDPEAIEALLINLLSWYDIVYADPREVPEGLTGLTNDIDYDAIGLNKAELEALPGQLDDLITAVLPLVGELLPTLGVNLDIDLTGGTVQAIVQNLLVSLFKDSEDKAGFATTLFTALVNLFGKGKLDSILTLVYELTGGGDEGINLTLKYFKDQNDTIADVFDGLDTWEEAYNEFYTVDAYDADVHFTWAEDNEATPDVDESKTVKIPYLNNGTNLLATTSVEDGEDEEGNKLYKTVPVIALAKDKDGNNIPAAADAEKLTDSYGSTYYTKAAAADADDEDILKDAEGNTIYVAETKDGAVVYAEQYSLKIEDTNSFGVKNYDSLLTVLKAIVTPFVPVLKLLMLEDNDLVILDGVSISSGDGYDRFFIPLAEVIGVPQDKIASKAQLAEIDTNAEFAQFVIDYITTIIETVLSAPVETIINLLPRLSYFIASNGLANAVEQLLAPVLTLVDMVNEVAAAEIPVGEETVVALDVYGFLVNLIKGLGLPGLENATSVSDIINALLTEAGLIGLINGLVNKDKASTDEGYIDFSFLNFGTEEAPVYIFTEIVNNTAEIGDVDTKREFGALRGKVKGVQTSNADILVGLISHMILADATIVDGAYKYEDGLLKTIFDIFNIELNDTVQTIIDGITGENCYNVLEVLLNYFNHYDVENDLLEYLSFEDKSFDYETYSVDSNLTARKVRRAIKKLDKAILALIPDLLPMLEEVAFLKGALDNIKAKNNGTYTGVTLADVVEALLTDLAFKDDMMDTIVGAVIGAIGTGSIAETLNTVLPILNDLLEINFTPAEVATNATGTTLATVINAAIAAADLENEDGTTRAATWSDIAAYYAQNVYYYVETTEVADDPATEEDEAKTTYAVKSFTSKEVYEDAKEATFTIDGVEYTATVYAYNVEITEANAATGTVTYKLNDKSEKVAAGTKVVLTADWGIDDADTFAAKKDAFINILWGFISELEPVLNFLLRGEDIVIKATGSDEAALTLKGGNGYEYALLPLLRGLAADQLNKS
ncbi:MAG: hypothetical protein J6V06_05135, partial [Clostridia bacterium]|nr:hypothetical protein [Clostridia bacterium]